MRSYIGLMALALALAAGCQDNLEMTSVEPGTIQSGDPVLLDVKGTGFKEGTEMTIGNQPAKQMVVASSTRIVALPPDNISPGVHGLTLIRPDGKTAALEKALTVESSLTLVAITPTFALAGQDSITVYVKGAGFMPDSKFFLGDVEAIETAVSGKSVLKVSVPAVKPGVYDALVKNPDGAVAVLPGAFQILAPDQDLPLQQMRNESGEKGVAGEKSSQDHGASVADVNGDGFLDLVVSGNALFRLYLGDGQGGFSDFTDTSGVEPAQNSYGSFLADYDNDGKLDILLTGKPTKLFKNTGKASFLLSTEEAGIDPLLHSWGATWGDYDADGWIDLFIGGAKGDDHLYHNTGGAFEEVSPELFEKMEKAREYGNPQPTTFSASFGDVDNDGFVDLFVGVRGQPSSFFLNLKGEKLENATQKFGFDFSIEGDGNRTFFKPNWGVSWADFNNDGFLDLFLSSGIAGADLLMNKEGVEFENVTRRMRVNFTDMNLSPVWGDFDNDGWLDLALSDNLSGAKVYRNKGDGSFRDVSEDLGIPRKTFPVGMAWADFNRDGALDLYMTCYLDENPLFMNSPYPGRHFLEVELKAKTATADGLGAVVMVRDGATLLTRQVSGGEGYLNQPPPVLHFGLGSAEKVDSVTVRWPGGQTQTIENVAADQVLEIVQEKKE